MLPGMMTHIDAILNDPRWAPRWGWHDNHRHADRLPEYLPAIQQVRGEFAGLLDVLQSHGVLGGSCLQLGLGECRASHAVWASLFPRMTATIDWSLRRWESAGDWRDGPGFDTHDIDARIWAERPGPYDFLFIDAGHKLDDVRRDHEDYSALVRHGGIIAFHDALKRPGYEDEIDVWRYLETVPDVHMIGTEVGVAWIEKR